MTELAKPEDGGAHGGECHEHEHHPKHHQHHHEIEVLVYTTSGSYPHHGFVAVPVTDKVSLILADAKEALHLTDTSTWVATVAGNEIDPNRTFEQDGLKGQVTIQWGPREGGGG